MPVFEFTCDKIVKRLRWFMIGAMIFSMLNTLFGQPKSFWHNADTAIRGDGLSIHDRTNHAFEFFLGHGWLPYVAASLVYLAAVFILVSTLPRLAALVVTFSLLFSNYFSASIWMAVRWRLGGGGSVVYGILLAVFLVPAMFPDADAAGPLVKRMRWLMLAAILVDSALTLMGQPGSYWLRPETANEANPFFRVFLARGWLDYIVFDIFYIAGAFLLVSALSRMPALISILAFVFGHFYGASTWLFYRWRLGAEAPWMYAVLLSAVIVWLGFRGDEKSGRSNPVAVSSTSP
jgi:hypothetical protein